MLSKNFINKFNIKEQQSLKNLNWFKVGGVAEYFFSPKDLLQLKDFLKHLPKDINITILGAGSNVLIRDGGIDGVVIKLTHLNSIKLDVGGVVKAQSGALNLSVANFALEKSLSGLEFLSGIPGSLGGGLAMNAGAFEKEFKDVVISCKAITLKGEEIELLNSDMGFKYRENSLKEQVIFTSVLLHGVRDDAVNIENKMKEIALKREETQPKKVLTGGSTFANPNNADKNALKAWQLIDKAGLRGHIIGGASFAEKHCNFIINHNNATSRDIEDLILLAQSKVKEQFGVDLKSEIKILGKY